MADAVMLSVETVRPFVPARDFVLCQKFYVALGFGVTQVSPRMATVATPDGKPAFLLQDFYVREFAENLMMQLIVPDVDEWWRHIQSTALTDIFDVRQPRAPQAEPWGARVAYVWDPSGVLWHVASKA